MMVDFKKQCILIAIAATMSGCSTFKEEQPNDPRFAPVPPQTMPQPNIQNGSIYQSAYSKNLFEDRRANKVGDIITIRLVENTSASKEANTKTERESNVGITNPTVLGSTPQFNAPGVLPLASNQNNNLQMSLASDNDFEGKATSDQKNSLSGVITVTVSQVLPNGYLLVRGEKWMTLNQGDEYVRISGMVRPDDIDANNEVLSTRVANARISYSGTGEVADSNKTPWLAKFFSSVFWLF